MLRLIDTYRITKSTEENHPQMAGATFNLVIASSTDFDELRRLQNQYQKIADEREHNFTITSAGPKEPTASSGWYELPDGTMWVYRDGGFIQVD